MVARKRIKEVYVKDTAFTQSELDYINKCVLSIPYEIDVTRATILIPTDHSEIYRDNLHVLHLINQFGFTAQITIGATTHEVKVFDPVLRSAPIRDTSEREPIVMPKRGEIWKDSNDATRKYIEKVDKDSYRVKFLNSLINDKTFKLSDIEFLIGRGDLIKEER